jgi:hypothetical protein
MDDLSKPGASRTFAAPFSPSGHPSGRAVDTDEAETHPQAVEVLLMWGSTVVHVSHLTPPRPFYVGEALDCDCFIPSEVLGATRMPLIACAAGTPSLVLWPRSTGYVDAPGEGRSSLADLVASGRARGSAAMQGAHELALVAGARALIELGMSLSLRVNVVRAARRSPAGLLAATEPEALLYTGLSFLFHAGMVAAFAFFMPGMRGDGGEAIDRDRILMMQRMLDASAARERERPVEQDSETRPDAREGGTGASARGEAGSLGTPGARATGHRYAVQGPRDNLDPHLAKLAALSEAERFGLIGYLSSFAGGDPEAPTARWGREDSLGKDTRSAPGNLFGETIGDALGTGGLGLTGPGEGGGGPSEGIGLRDFGVFDHGGGPGTREGIGVGHDRPSGGHAVRAPRMRELSTSVRGRLPPEVIQRVVRQNFGRFRYCYEKGIRSDPALRGRVAVKFVIDRSGAVAVTSDAGSDLRDQGVIQCVVAGFGDLSFPPPEAGMVTVVYPILFEPGE